jgi:hypothetical protein
MKKICFIILIGISIKLSGQTSNNLYGIVSKNYYSWVTAPFDSTIIYEQFDSATIRLGYMDPSVGLVYNRGPYTYNQAINLTGAALNPYDSTFVFMGGYGINTFDLNQGNITFQAPVVNPIAASFFDNFRFNNADSTMYGLARRNTYDPITMQNFGELYLAKINTQNGIITQISPNSVGQGFALAGSAIDPYQMVYYYSTGANLIGLDLYTGNIYSDVPMLINNGDFFDNFTYSCADTALYGLIRTNYVTYYYDSLFPLDSIPTIDSSTVKLGKINPSTGAVTTISPSAISYGGYSLNAGAAIDPDAMIYYYSTGSNLIGVSMLTGMVVSNVQFSFEDGLYFNLMRNFENCKSAKSSRLNPTASVLDNGIYRQVTNVYPNPSNTTINILSAYLINEIAVSTIDGKKIMIQNPDEKEFSINVEILERGIYFLTLFREDNQVETKKIIIN